MLDAWKNQYKERPCAKMLGLGSLRNVPYTAGSRLNQFEQIVADSSQNKSVLIGQLVTNKEEVAPGFP